MSAPTDTKDTKIRLSESITGETQKHLMELVQSLTSQGATRMHVDCSDLSRLTREHIWLLMQVQTLCEAQGIAVLLTAPTPTLFNIETLGSLIEASSSLTKRTAPKVEPVPAPAAPQQDPHKFEQIVRASATDIARSTREFESYLGRIGLQKVDRYVLRTLYTEAVQNIYRHAGLRDSQEFQIVVERSDKCISLTFIDEGPRFDPTAESALSEQISDPEVTEFPHFGIKMLKRLADDLTYQRSQSNKNVLRIIKELQQ